MQHGFERMHSGFGIAGHIDDQALAQGAGNGATHSSEWCLLCTLAPHPLSETFQNAFASRSRGFRCDVSRSNPGTACGNNETVSSGLLAQNGDNLIQIVRNSQNSLDRKTGMAQAGRNCRTGAVYPLACKAGIANGNNNGVHIGDSTWLE